jgi:hypothetical protein
MRRKPTESDRVTVVQEFRTLIGPELGAEPGACRKITLMTPASPQVNFVLTPYTLRALMGDDVTVINDPRALGLNQYFKAAPLTIASTIHFEITAEQSIIASCTEGVALMSMVVEYV